MNLLKRIVAGEEIARLDRYENAMHLVARWFASIPNVEPVVRYLWECADLSISPNTISEVRAEVEANIAKIEGQKQKEDQQRNMLAQKLLDARDLKTRTQLEMIIKMQAKIERQDAELTAVHAQLAHERLRADQGWQRYEEANAKCNSMSQSLATANAEVFRLCSEEQRQSAWTLKWFEALHDCATLLNMKVGQSICDAPLKLKSFLANHKFVFINEPKEEPVSNGVSTKTLMHEAIKASHPRMCLMPGIPCNACQDNCCVPTNQGCAIVQMRKPNES